MKGNKDKILNWIINDSSLVEVGRIERSEIVDESKGSMGGGVVWGVVRKNNIEII